MVTAVNKLRLTRKYARLGLLQSTLVVAPRRNNKIIPALHVTYETFLQGRKYKILQLSLLHRNSNQ